MTLVCYRCDTPYKDFKVFGFEKLQCPNCGKIVNIYKKEQHIQNGELVRK